MPKNLLLAGILAAGAIATQASAGVVQVNQTAFVAGAGLITFSEFPSGTVNPVYAPATYGGGPSSPTVTFGGFFTGQSAGSTNPSACPAGAAVTGCVLGNPSATLSLAAGSPNTFITGDGAQPNSPILSGTPTYSGSIAILFSIPQVGVGLFGGFFNAVGSTAITAYDSTGAVIGQVANSITGVEFLGLVTDSNAATISGLLFSLVGNEPFGFDVDSIRFGVAGQVVNPNPVPEPATMALLGAGLFGIAALRRRT